MPSALYQSNIISLWFENIFCLLSMLRNHGLTSFDTRIFVTCRERNNNSTMQRRNPNYPLCTLFDVVYLLDDEEAEFQELALKHRDEISQDDWEVVESVSKGYYYSHLYGNKYAD